MTDQVQARGNRRSSRANFVRAKPFTVDASRSIRQALAQYGGIEMRVIDGICQSSVS
jgi:hypothetical protein